MKKEKKETTAIEKAEVKSEDTKKPGIQLKKVTVILLAVFMTLLIALFIYVFTLYNKLADLEYKGEMNNNPSMDIETPEVTDDVEGLPEFQPATPSPSPSEAVITAKPSPSPTPEGITNILIIGCDSKKMGAFDNARSDVNMILTIDEINNEIKLTSFARDIMVYYDFLTGLDGNEGGYNKLNAALQFYDHPDGVIKTIEENFSIGIDYYMLTDYWGVEKIINTLGGVRVYLTDKETYALNDVLAAYNKTYDHPIDENFVTHGAGVKFLNGRQAVSFMRIRKIDSDFGRIDRQHEVLEALKIRISEMDLLDVIAIIDKLPNMIFTDMSQDEIIKYTKLLYSMKDLEIQHATVPFDNTWEFARYGSMSVISIDFVKNNELLVEFIYK
ncbi:MAG: LCP family protein [Clostridia bacterium]|nr:LCP family protein [Clostridia bacterium]